MSLIFQELQQLDGELGQAQSALPSEEDEFLRCIAFKAASMPGPVNAEPVEEPLWLPGEKQEFFSPRGSHWVAGGWSSTGVPERSAAVRHVRDAGVHQPIARHLVQVARQLLQVLVAVAARSPRPMVNGARISENRATLSRRERSQRGDSTDKNVSVVAAVAIGLVAVSFAVGLAQSRSRAKIRH